MQEGRKWREPLRAPRSAALFQSWLGRTKPVVIFEEDLNLFWYVSTEGAGIPGRSGELLSDVADGRHPSLGRRRAEDDRGDPRHSACASHFIIIIILFLLLLLHESGSRRRATGSGRERARCRQSHRRQR